MLSACSRKKNDHQNVTLYKNVLIGFRQAPYPSNTKVVLWLFPVKAKFQRKGGDKRQHGGIITVPLLLRMTLDKFLNGI